MLDPTNPKVTPVRNNTWIRRSQSHTVVIFVHGILSNSDSCWRNPKAKTYWPELVAADPSFEDCGIFVSGYVSSMNAGLYDIRDAAGDVFASLRTHTPSPLDKQRLLFICHSQGGIVLRQLLCLYPEAFKTKSVGIILCGSPSWGSFYANILFPVALFFRHRQATALRWGGQPLMDLDRDFRRLSERGDIPNLTGTCLVEAKLWGPIPAIVSTASAASYFNSWHRIPDSTHFSLVKPVTIEAESHVQVLDFAQQNGFLTRRQLLANLAQLLIAMEELDAAYKPGELLAQRQKTLATISLLQIAKQTLEAEDDEGRFSTTKLRDLIKADLDAAQEWAFSRFPRDAFQALKTDLVEIRQTIEKAETDRPPISKGIR